MDYPLFRILVLLYFSALTYGQSVKIFDNIRFSGDAVKISLSETNCINVPQNWNDRASSIQLETDCVELFEHNNCGGRSTKLKRDSPHLDNFVELNFNDELTSLRACDGSGGGGGGGGSTDVCFAEHNDVRAREGLPPFEFNEKIARASQIHIDRVVRERCADNGQNPHRCPGEKGFGERFEEQGYYSWGAAENIAAGDSDCKKAVEGWMNSEGHRANIIAAYKHIGCGRQGNWYCCGYANPA